MKKIAIIFGYNNTRIYDIERLKGLCKQMFGADIMLCKEKITEQDLSITPYCIELDLEKNSDIEINNQIRELDSVLKKQSLSVVACLPFSDKGIPLGSYYAAHLGLSHDDCPKAIACIDKHAFRCLESKEKTPHWYKKPLFKKVHTLDDAKECVEQSKGPLFFKPVAEGNSRGCIEINELADINSNLEIIQNYLTQGIIVEECIKNCDEYSFDGVDGNYVITEKKTSQGYYRVETQHILPAPLNHDFYNRLLEAGKIVSNISGSNNGAVHNELFLDKTTGDVYCVEPNRRPAGLKLWDWVKIAYPGIDNWTAWLNWAVGKTNGNILPKNKYFVGCRMLQADKTGTIKALLTKVKDELSLNDAVVEVVITKKVGDKVTSDLKDNSDFIGYIVCKAETYPALCNVLDSVEQSAKNIFEIE